MITNSTNTFYSFGSESEIKEAGKYLKNSGMKFFLDYHAYLSLPYNSLVSMIHAEHPEFSSTAIVSRVACAKKLVELGLEEAAYHIILDAKNCPENVKDQARYELFEHISSKLEEIAPFDAYLHQAGYNTERAVLNYVYDNPGVRIQDLYDMVLEHLNIFEVCSIENLVLSSYINVFNATCRLSNLGTSVVAFDEPIEFKPRFSSDPFSGEDDDEWVVLSEDEVAELEASRDYFMPTEKDI